MRSQVVRRWNNSGDTIRLTVTSDGKTGQECINLLKQKGYKVNFQVERLLLSKDFHPTNGVYHVVVLRGKILPDNHRTIQNIWAEAKRRKFSFPNAEIAFLIRVNFTDEDIKAMGLWRILCILHLNSNRGSDSGPNLLNVDCDDGGCLSASYGSPGSRRLAGSGLAFIESASSEN